VTLKLSFIFVVVVAVVLVSVICSSVDSSLPETPTSLPVSTPTPTQSGGPSQPNNLETATVARVVDGDTIELADGRRVRYIGMNTPERDQPYYKEATDINRQLVEGKTVQLEFDVETFDQYGRTLAYIWIEGIMANLEIVQQGYANAFVRT
jgi:micrococcal nuclease